MSKQISLTLPDVVVEALEVRAKPYELTGGEWLKQQLIGSVMGDMPPLGLRAALARAMPKENAEQLEMLPQEPTSTEGQP